MESIWQRALRDATCSNRFPLAAGVRRARRPDKSKTAACGVRRKTGRRIATGAFQGKRIAGKGMYVTRIQAEMPALMHVRLPLPPEFVQHQIPLPEIRLPYSPARRITLPHFSFRHNRGSIGVLCFSGFTEPASLRCAGLELG